MANEPHRTGRRNAFVSTAIIAGISILVILWIARTPYEPGVLHGTVPSGAVLVTSHSNPGDSFAGLATNAILLNIVRSLNPEAHDIIAEMDPNVVRGITALAGSRETVTAMVPSPIPGEEASWYSASWIGASSIYVRFLLFFRPLPELRPVGQYAGWTIWGMEQPLTDTGLKLSVAVGDGILFLCLSRQSSGVKHAIAVHEGLAPQAPSPDTNQASAVRLTSDDTGWLRMGSRFVQFEASEVTSTRLALRFHLDYKLPPLQPLREAVDLAVPRRLLADHPVVLAAAPVDIISKLASDNSSPAWLKIIGEILDMEDFDDDRGIAVMSVHTGSHAGGIGRPPFRMRIPAVILMLKSAGGDASVLLNTMTDRLNAEHRLGLIVHPETRIADDIPLWILEATNDNILAQLEPDDRIACAALDQWIIFGSNAGSLTSLLAGFRNRTPDDATIAWYHAAQNREASALLWVNTHEAAKAAQLPILLLSMKMGTGNTAVQEKLADARALLKAARAFPDCSIFLESGTGHPVFQVSLDGSGPGACR